MEHRYHVRDILVGASTSTPGIPLGAMERFPTGAITAIHHDLGRCRIVCTDGTIGFTATATGIGLMAAADQLADDGPREITLLFDEHAEPFVWRPVAVLPAVVGGRIRRIFVQGAGLYLHLDAVCLVYLVLVADTGALILKWGLDE